MKVLSIILVGTIGLISSCQKEEIIITSSKNTKDITAQINSFPKEELNSNETESLIFMREEEKLAHDVYITLYNKWGVAIFNNISNSEKTHTNAVLTLLNKYELVDPVETNAIGIFNDAILQDLYNQLVTQGSISLLEGYKVGATIEDLDIFDLNNWLTKVDNQDIIYVYENLNKGSRNHLRSFYSQILNSNGSYDAQYITQNELDAIINSSIEIGSL